MRIEFDPAKNDANIAKHGLPLTFAARILVGSPTVVEDARQDYGETRYQAYGVVAGRLHVCVYTVRGDAYRIISVRKANRREVDAHR
ncbi:MAG TPA: BrnT family toxin [Azospirillaceae bacterium]|nr:BrnT family toxin [Azospirillaceae bacterium]